MRSRDASWSAQPSTAASPPASQTQPLLAASRFPPAYAWLRLIYQNSLLARSGEIDALLDGTERGTGTHVLVKTKDKQAAAGATAIASGNNAGADGDHGGAAGTHIRFDNVPD